MVRDDISDDLIYQLLAGEVSEEEHALLKKRFAQDEELRERVLQMERLRQYGRYAGKWELINDVRAWEKINRKQNRRLKGWKLYAGVAACFILLFSVSAVFLWKNDQLPEQQTAGIKVLPGESKALLILASGQAVELGRNFPQTIMEDGVAIKGDSAVVEYRGNLLNSENKYNELVVPVGGEYRLRLADGTTVYLNSESRLKYPVAFGRTTREVELEGEGYFEVAPDATRPFCVHTPGMVVNVLGTGFNVMAYRGDDRAEVTLVHGRVAAGAGKGMVVLKPDEQLVFNRQTNEQTVRKVNARRMISWTEGVLNFDAMPLDELAAKLSRWFDVEFFFTSEQLKQLKFSGAFKKYNDIQYILPLIEATTDIRLQLKGRTIMVEYK